MKNDLTKAEWMLLGVLIGVMMAYLFFNIFGI